MKLYTPGEKYVTLTTLIRVTLECIIIVAMLGAVFWSIEHGHLVAGCLLGVAAAVGLSTTIILAAMWVRQ